jgi:outer membrane receptor for ferrienterochelin and colicin
LPVQVLTREDIERGGSTTVAELMSKLSANLLSFNDQVSIGSQLLPLARPDQSTVNLRGIGDGSTLVLINGRRVANYAFDGGAVDVNSRSQRRSSQSGGRTGVPDHADRAKDHAAHGERDQRQDTKSCRSASPV